MKKAVLMSCLAAALLAYAGAASFAEDEYDARLSSIAGTADVQTGGEADPWREAEEGMPLSAGDKVRTGEGSSAEITLDDGGVIRLSSDSSVDISSLSSGSSSFTLRLGALVAKIRAGFIKTRKKMEVRTPAAVCAVRGTEFGVEHDQASGETTAGVFDEGSLSVASTGKDGSVLSEETVGKGNEVRLRAGARAFKAGAMQRLLRHRKTLEMTRKRLGILQRGWKRLDPEKRRDLRKRFLTRKAVIRKVRGIKQGGAPGKQGPAKGQKRSEAIEKFKNRKAGKRNQN